MRAIVAKKAVTAMEHEILTLSAKLVSKETSLSEAQEAMVCQRVLFSVVLNSKCFVDGSPILL
jgi:hypothetical protein